MWVVKIQVQRLYSALMASMLRDGNGSRGNKIFRALDNSEKKLNPLSFYGRYLIFGLTFGRDICIIWPTEYSAQDFAKKSGLIKRDSINQLMRSSLFVKYGDVYYRVFAILEVHVLRAIKVIQLKESDLQI
ncbi:hypothetical protein CDAR_503631 [Caerostris darwini]|uniref:Uncharacterized protein n=1 Tax=Caerostris darwini TaxID=1538125 RepID=A0AAV4NQZ2_9ARAC|nr:hypothetical protein CDAR_503631 [Caerostris darwini]